MKKHYLNKNAKDFAKLKIESKSIKACVEGDRKNLENAM